MNTSRSLYLLAPDLPAIHEPIRRSFEQRGWKTRGFYFRMASYPRLLLKLRKITNPLYEAERVTKHYNHILRTELIPALRSDPPALLLVLKGHHLDPDNLASLQALKPALFLWYFDSSARFPGQQQLAPLARRIYVMDRGDVLDERHAWLPLGYDDNLYRPRDDPPDIDILFAGKLGRRWYRKREQYIRLLADSELPEIFHVAAVGSTGSHRRDRNMGLKPPFDWIAKRLPAQEYARTVARARLVVNIHQDDGSEPVNPMLFAIAGSRVCEVAEDSPWLAEWLKPGEHYLPVNETNFIPALERLLADGAEQERLRAAGYEAAREHSFARRIDLILADFERLEADA